MAHDFDAFPELTNPQMQMYYFQSPHKQIVADFRAKVIKVTDGDTIRVSAPFRDFDFPVRIAAIAAPELNEEGGVDSRDWLKSRIEGLEIEIIIDRDNRVGRFGRLIGRVMSFGLDIGEQSLLAGKSVPFNQRRDSGLPDIGSMIRRAGI